MMASGLVEQLAHHSLRGGWASARHHGHTPMELLVAPAKGEIPIMQHDAAGWVRLERDVAGLLLRLGSTGALLRLGCGCAWLRLGCGCAWLRLGCGCVWLRLG